MISFFAFLLIFIFDLAEILRSQEYQNNLLDAINLTKARIIYVYAQIMHYVILLSTIIVMYFMVSKNEIIILKSTGRSAFNILFPFLLVAGMAGMAWLFCIHPIATNMQRQNIFIDKRYSKQMVTKKVWLDYGTDIIYCDLEFYNHNQFDMKNIFINKSDQKIYAKSGCINDSILSLKDCMIIEQNGDFEKENDDWKDCDGKSVIKKNADEKIVDEKKQNSTSDLQNKNDQNRKKADEKLASKYVYHYADTYDYNKKIENAVFVIFSHLQWYYFTIYEYFFLQNYSEITNLSILKYGIYMNSLLINSFTFILFIFFAALLFFKINRYVQKTFIGIFTIVFVFCLRIANDFCTKLAIDDKISVGLMWFPCVLSFVVIFLLLVMNEE